MKKAPALVVAAGVLLALMAGCGSTPNQEEKDQRAVQAQQSQYAKGQPVPAFDWSLERDLIIKLYGLRNQKVMTHAVVRSDYGSIQFDCPSMGYGLPYDTSLTNPSQLSTKWINRAFGRASGVIGQAEPNGIFASTNTAATWIMCIDPDSGQINPVYTEAKVSIYPRPMRVDYQANRVYPAGKATVSLGTK